MRFSGYSKTLFVMVILLVFSQFCFSMETSRSYSELLKGAVRGAGHYHGGYYMYSPKGGGYGELSEWEWPDFRCVEGLGEKEAVPFLVEVITNGPDWPIEEFKGYYRIGPHIARCYAAMCLASTRDRRAYPVLIDLLQNGAYLGELSVPEESDDHATVTAEAGFRRTGEAPFGRGAIDRGVVKGDLEGYDVRAYAAIGLGILGDPNAVGLLVDALDSDSPQLRQESFLALARLGDMRATEAMIKKAENDEAISQSSFIYGMVRFTRIVFSSKWNRNGKETSVSFSEFPELGRIDFKQDPFKKAWQHWFKVGREWTRQQSESKYNNWKEAKKKHPQQEHLIKKRARELTKPGIAALPFLIDRIAEGETEWIEQVSTLTRGKIKKDAGREDVLQWWNKNKAKWIIPFKD